MSDHPEPASITPEIFRRIREVFESALECPVSERQAFLERECVGDALVMEQVRRMLAAEVEASPLLDAAGSISVAPTRSGECSGCKAEIALSHQYCPFCGTPVELVRRTDGRFRAGTLFANRFRIVGLLGRGGMGEVYRAQDLELDQPVALKFLTAIRFDERARARLRNEVRLARQVSHPNVCRVYDIGEAQGELFLTMEYVDGEDLGALLRRIGKLPVDKGVEIALKLCDGLAAAHAKGVLHRDLKPANIMIDGSGEVRIMDFGLAAIADDVRASHSQEGTPLYMAPEQLAGEKVSVQSDIYALGLVLYEMLTGKPPFSGNTPAELRQLREESRATPPSSHIANLEPAVERAILRCLEPDRGMRPASALAVAGMLPGGDPLARALAAGETPSPATIAAAGPTEPLRRTTALLLLAAIGISVGVLAVVAPEANLLNWLSLENPPEVLVAKAQEIRRSLGYTDRPEDQAWGFRNQLGWRDEFFEYMKDKVVGEEQWRKTLSMPPAPLSFWYRQSPEPIPSRGLPYWNTDAVQRVRPEDPLTPGAQTVEVDTQGRLTRFESLPGRNRVSTSTHEQASELDWSRLFALAGLEYSRFSPAPPDFTRVLAADTRVAWTGTYGERPNVPLRVEAASLQGRVVHFEVLLPWWNGSIEFDPPFFDATFIVIFIASILLAHRNWRTGGADLSGALRVGVFLSLVIVTYWVLESDFADSGAIVVGFLSTAAPNALFAGATSALFYLAVEPWGRRELPGIMISWSRILTGRWKDPLIGRDILLGSLFGLVGVNLFVALGALNVLRLSGHPPPISWIPGSEGPIALTSPFSTLTEFFSSAWGAVGTALLFFGMMLTLKVVLRNKWLAAAGVAAFFALTTPFPTGEGWSAVLIRVLWAVAMVAVMLRFGLFAVVVAVLASAFASGFITTEFSMWYGKSSVVGLVGVATLALIGFRLSLLGRPLWSDVKARTAYVR